MPSIVMRELQCTLQDGLPSVASGKETEQVVRSAALKLSGAAHALFVLGVGGAVLNKKRVKLLVKL